jgi:hypothetical protein
VPRNEFFEVERIEPHLTADADNRQIATPRRDPS